MVDVDTIRGRTGYVTAFRSNPIFKFRVHLVAIVFLLLLTAIPVFLSRPVQAAFVLTITTGSLPDATTGSPYSATLTATGGMPPYGWTITIGSLPSGLSLDSATGVISGVPSDGTAGTHYFTATVSDKNGASASKSLHITVLGLTQPALAITIDSLPDAATSCPYTATLTATGGTPPYAWTITAGSLPPGLLLDSAIGLISGVPEHGTAGTYGFTVTVEDSKGMTHSKAFGITVEEGMYEVTVTIGTSLPYPCETIVYIDGGSIGNLKGGQSLTMDFPIGSTHVVGVEPQIPHPEDPNTRFTAVDHSMTITDAHPNAIFEYSTEYLIKYRIEPPGIVDPPASAWYLAGSIVKASMKGVIEEPGVQYRFSYWLLPTGKTVTSPELETTAEQGGEIESFFDVFFDVSLSVEPAGLPLPSGSGFYKSGSEFSGTATATLDGPIGTQYRFSHWLLPTGEKVALTNLATAITSATKIVAVYDVYYLLTVTSEYGTPAGAGFYRAGSTATWSVGPTDVPIPGIMGLLGGRLRAKNPEGTEVMTSPKEVTVLWDTDYVLPLSLAVLAISLLGFGTYHIYRSGKKAQPCGASLVCPHCNKEVGLCQMPRAHEGAHSAIPEHPCNADLRCPVCHANLGNCTLPCGHQGNHGPIPEHCQVPLRGSSLPRARRGAWEQLV